MKYISCILFCLCLPILCLAEVRSGIYIDSLLAAPSQGEEWVMIKNTYAESVMMEGWKLCDKTNKCVKLSSIAAKENLSLKTTFLNNTGDTITLKDACDQVVDTVTYPSMKKDVVWYRDPLPKKEEAKKEDIKMATVPKTINEETKTEEKTPLISKLLPWVTVPDIAVAQASDGSLELVVTVPPGIFDDKSLYAQDQERGYVLSFGSKVELPEVSQGTVIRVTGEVEEKGGRNIIKITNADQITVTEEISEMEPKAGMGGFGEWVRVSGTVQNKTAYGFVLHGEEEISVGLKKKTGISFTNIKKGESWAITGIVEKKTDGTSVVWPRFEEDLERIYEQAEVSTQDISDILDQVQNNRFWMYLIGFVLMGIGGMGYLGYKYRYLWQKPDSVDETP